MRRRNFIELTTAVGMVNIFGCSSGDDTENYSKPMGEEQINTMADTIHHNILTLDSHNDIQYEFIEQGLNLGSRIENRQVDLVKMEEGGLDAVFFVVWTGQKKLTGETFSEAYHNALTYFDAIHNMC